MTMDVERRNFEMSIPVTRAFSLFLSLLVFSGQIPYVNLSQAFPSSTAFRDIYIVPI